ncbi:phosphoribosylanthranilate isomerase [Engelhardtia mirabilis]|uniref:N-(5'-phosphoribosyl)anthranilate isomerase n=1 Tax=Engelhardtia mirabilis TaxID=2528011 RepID=A0A518BQ88_9BACT|nr:N-(5'-phosphoribosyl)anthranilate isomerase [Planctomycetes bacterium Pla133]QDV03447.1 N-(5'-phosphoribosyl)anthranilate isomerase [Planctomycetes bacterium Pla86]
MQLQPLRTRVKICCIASIDEARTAIAAGADALGLVAAMPSGPGVIDEDTIRAIARAVPPPVATFLLTARTEAADIAEHAREAGTSCVQVVNHVDPDECARLRELLAPAVRLVQVIHVTGEDALALARDYAPHADALLLDSGRPDLPTPELGGTGRAHDWSISARLVAEVECPVFLAGGLHPGNVARAIDAVRPHGLDLCSGVRSAGALDSDLLARFMGAVAGAGR